MKNHSSLLLKQQLEELYAAQNDGFADIIEVELQKLEWCNLMIWQFPFVVVYRTCYT